MTKEQNMPDEIWANYSPKKRPSHDWVGADFLGGYTKYIHHAKVEQLEARVKELKEVEQAYIAWESKACEQLRAKLKAADGLREALKYLASTIHTEAEADPDGESINEERDSLVIWVRNHIKEALAAYDEVE